MYTIRDGNLENQAVVRDENVPQKVKGRWPEAPRSERVKKVQRHIQNHLNHHFQYLARKSNW